MTIGLSMLAVHEALRSLFELNLLLLEIDDLLLRVDASKRFLLLAEAFYFVLVMVVPRVACGNPSGLACEHATHERRDLCARFASIGGLHQMLVTLRRLAVGEVSGGEPGHPR